MKKSIVVSLLIIVLAVAAITGGTLAWFTAQANIEPNLFTAGTVEIEAGETFNSGQGAVSNWNPGDCTDKEVWVQVKGTKGVYLRFKINDGWYEPSAQPGEWEEWDLGELTNPVSYGLPNENWVWLDGYYYYAGGRIEPDTEKIEVISKVCLSGEAGNDFQGKQYRIGFEFRAIQTTHEAAFSEWGVGYLTLGDNPGWYSVSQVGGIWTLTDSDDDVYEWDPSTETWGQQQTTP